jgi:LysM repeat protein
VVEEGDTLSGVADKFDVSVKRLERLNPDIDPQTIGAGQELQIR